MTPMTWFGASWDAVLNDECEHLVAALRGREG